MAEKAQGSEWKEEEGEVREVGSGRSGVVERAGENGLEAVILIRDGSNPAEREKYDWGV